MNLRSSNRNPTSSQETLGIAGIILAAGGASRYHSHKVLLPWKNGQPLIRHIVSIALDSRISCLTVVLGSITDPVKDILEDLHTKIVINPEWSSGQSSSIRAGLQSLPTDISACIFLLADQPFISSSLLDGMINVYNKTKGKIIAPRVGKKRSNPVIFDKSTFGDLLKLRGDVGGRSLFTRYEVTWFPWDDPKLLLDIDTPADYDRLYDLLESR